MELTTLVMPGAQSLVTAILSDSWGHLRSALSRMWARHHAEGAANPAPEAIEAAGRELDVVRDQALELAGGGDPGDRSVRMQLFLAGYLAGRLAARPDLAETVAALPALLGGGPATGESAVVDSSVVHNSFTGEAHSVVQARDVEGGISFH